MDPKKQTNLNPTDVQSVLSVTAISKRRADHRVDAPTLACRRSKATKKGGEEANPNHGIWGEAVKKADKNLAKVRKAAMLSLFWVHKLEVRIMESNSKR